MFDCKRDGCGLDFHLREIIIFMFARRVPPHNAVSRIRKTEKETLRQIFVLSHYEDFISIFYPDILLRKIEKNRRN